MRLSRWQKLGVALSIIWVIVVAIHQRNSDVEQAQRSAALSYRVCTEVKPLQKDPSLASCEAKKEQMRSMSMEHSWASVAITALAPLPILWIFGTILFYFGKAQVIGFRAAVDVRTMTPLKKAFVYFCCLSAAAFLFLGLLLLLNLYTDARVSVALSPTKSFYVNSTSDWITVSGTWAQSEQESEPIQTSTISCRREERTCVEARATVATGFGSDTLMSDLNEYPIQSWSDTNVVFGDDGFCIRAIYTIDLKTEAVSGVERSINPAPPTCAGNVSRNYQLVAGFPVYWAKRQAARPYLLRLMQAVFGN